MSQLTVFLRHAKRSNNKQLDLSKRELSFIPKQVFTIRAIQILNLSQNKIVSIQSCIQDLFRLKVLNLEENSIVELPQEILALPKLTTLSLKGNPLDNRFQKLLIPKNQHIPELIECLQTCFQTNKTVSHTPSWLKQHGQFKQQSNKEQKNYENDLNWDQSVFKVEKKRSHGPPSRQMNNRQTSASSNIEPQTQSKNGVLQLKIDNVMIGQQISMGGFSTIHRGQYNFLQVAIKKVFNPSISQQLLQQFMNQLSFLSKYRHPNIILLLGAITTPPTLLIVMQYVKEGTLYDLLHKRKTILSQKERRCLVQQLLGVFSYLNAHGVVHRDIKSHNVLVDKDYKVKLCDFGLARHKTQLNSGPMQFCGTPTYMAQQLFLKKAYDQSVDIFALGTLLYEIYAAEVPYAGLDPTDIKQKILKNPDLPSKSGIKKSVLEIINRCRSQDPKQRPRFKQLRDFNDW